jgi:hypothetical protein
MVIAINWQIDFVFVGGIFRKMGPAMVLQAKQIACLS